MDFTQEFDKMRPYLDSEIPAAIERVINDKQFDALISFLFPDKSKEEITQNFKNIKTINDFQKFFSYNTVKRVVNQTSDGLSQSGIDKLDNSVPYLYFANHRDIVLDSALMQLLLIENNHKTSQITVGNNLMSSEFIVDLGKLNKMFTFHRGGSKIRMYKNALLHSQYIRHVISEEKESLWIAHRDGRTKNGDDKTQMAVIKMLLMSGEDTLESIKALNILPVTISYEYEPCDAQKVQELYIAKRGEYIKQPNEDFKSILSGLKDYKGRIHMTFGTPINSMLECLNVSNDDSKALLDIVIKEIDYQIYQNFKLWPVNYIAYDIVNKLEKHIETKYTQDQKLAFIKYANKKVADLHGDKDELNDMFYCLYAKPVENKYNSDDSLQAKVMS